MTGVAVQPGQVTLSVGQTANLTATLSTSNCSSPPAITWASAITAQVAVQSTGGLATVTGVAPTAAAVSVTATSAGMSASAQVTVLPLPSIVLTPANLAFTAAQGGANPPSQVTTITNGGGGSLSGLSIGAITYGPGAAGWLQASTLSGTTANPSVTLTVQPVTGSLAIGTYMATVPVQSGVAANSPQSVTATFTVAGPDPCLFANAPPITVGQTINGTLSAATSCLLTSGHYADNYKLTLNSATTVTIDLSAPHDSYLFVLDFTTGAIIEEDDDDGPGLDSHISRNLPAGQYIIQASTFSTGVTGPYTLTLQAVVPGVPASVAINAGNAQIAAPGTNVPIAPSVVVRDGLGSGVAGLTVTFATVSTVGSITGPVATTDVNGIATVGSWNLAAGTNVLSATVSGVGTIPGNPAIFTATGSTSAAGYNVILRFLTMPSLPQLQAFTNAVTRWQTIITNDLADISNVVLPPGACSPNSPAINENMDDLVIEASLIPIDGPGGVLGAAGPCFIRTAGFLPLLGGMVFDVADVAALEANGSLGSVILHEMGHVIGIGSLWTRFNLLANPSLPNSPGVDTRYTGVNGIAGFDSIGGTTYTGGLKVPVENTQGGQGTRDTHWRESVLANELMTGFLNMGSNPLSLLTVRSLQDLGYSVNTAAADPFFLVLTLRAEGGIPPQSIHLLNDVRSGPIYRMDPRGRVTDLQGRPVLAAPQKPPRR